MTKRKNDEDYEPVRCFIAGYAMDAGQPIIVAMLTDGKKLGIELTRAQMLAIIGDFQRELKVGA